MSDDALDVLEEVREELETLREEVAKLRSGRDDSDKLLTREEAADRLRISTSTLDDLADMGEIRPTRVRGRVLYHEDMIGAFIRENTS